MPPKMKATKAVKKEPGAIQTVKKEPGAVLTPSGTPSKVNNQTPTRKYSKTNPKETPSPAAVTAPARKTTMTQQQQAAAAVSYLTPNNPFANVYQRTFPNMALCYPTNPSVHMTKTELERERTKQIAAGMNAMMSGMPMAAMSQPSLLAANGMMAVPQTTTRAKTQQMNGTATSPTKKRKLKNDTQPGKMAEYSMPTGTFVKMETNMPWDRYQATMNPLLRGTPGKVTKADKKLQQGSPAGDGSATKKKRLQRPHAYIGDRAQKGLRQFSIKVCRKVKTKGSTTYNQVADELVEEFLSDPARKAMSDFDQAYDDKNIRRRVYDALNVLEAIGIIRKGEKKQIHWSGQSVISCESNVVKCENDKFQFKDAPTPTTESIDSEIAEREMALDAKRKKLRDMWEEYIFKKNVQSYAHQNASLSAEDVVMAPFTVASCENLESVECQFMNQNSAALIKGPKVWATVDFAELQKSAGFHVASDSLQKEWSQLPACITQQHAWPSTPEGSKQSQAATHEPIHKARVAYQPNNTGAAASFQNVLQKGIVQPGGGSSYQNGAVEVKEEKLDDRVLNCEEMLVC